MKLLDVNTTLNCNGTLLSLEKTIVMGILNTTPDSFFDGGKHHSSKLMLQQVEKMLSEGAGIIDIGGMSSRPGAAFVSEEEEFRRVIPNIDAILKAFPKTILSVDTWRANIAKASVEAGAGIVNDISGGQYDENLLKTIATLRVPYILMHIKGTPKDMAHQAQYNNISEEILTYFIEKLAILTELGVKDVILDLGFGFGKTLDHNYELLKNMDAFKILGLPMLAGISRKSMVYKHLDISPENALNGTTALHVVALQQGAKILRAHDVKEAIEVIQLMEKLNQS
jgi:dihydropteroate synthase